MIIVLTGHRTKHKCTRTCWHSVQTYYALNGQRVKWSIKRREREAVAVKGVYVSKVPSVFKKPFDWQCAWSPLFFNIALEYTTWYGAG
jgi:hypothetical protein